MDDMALPSYEDLAASLKKSEALRANLKSTLAVLTDQLQQASQALQQQKAKQRELSSAWKKEQQLRKAAEATLEDLESDKLALQIEAEAQGEAMAELERELEAARRSQGEQEGSAEGRRPGRRKAPGKRADQSQAADQDELETLKQSKAQVEAQLIDASKSKSQLETKLEEAVKGKAHLEAKLAEEVKGKSQLKAKLAEAVKGKSQLEAKLSEAVTGKVQMEAQLLGAIKGKAQLEKKLAEEVKGKSQIEANLEKAVIGKTQLEAKLTEAVAGKSQLEAELSEALKGRAETQARLLQALQGRPQLESQVSEASQKGRSQLDAQLSEATEVQAQLKAQLEANTELKAQIEAQTQLKAQLEAELSQVLKASWRAKLEREKAEAQQALAHLQGELIGVQAESDERAKACQLLELNAAAVMDLVRGNCVAMQQQIEEYEQTTGQLQSSCRGMEDLVREGQREKEALLSELAVASSRCDDLLQQVRSFEEMAEQLQQQIQEYQKTIGQLHSKCRELEGVVQEGDREHEGLLSELAAARSRCDDLQQQVRGFEEMAEQRQQQGQEYNQLVAREQERVARAKERAEGLKHTTMGLPDQIAELEQERAEKRKKAQSELQCRNAEPEGRIAEMEHGRFEEYEQPNPGLQRRIAELEEAGHWDQVQHNQQTILELEQSHQRSTMNLEQKYQQTITDLEQNAQQHQQTEQQHKQALQQYQPTPQKRKQAAQQAEPTVQALQHCVLRCEEASAGHREEVRGYEQPLAMLRDREHELAGTMHQCTPATPSLPQNAPAPPSLQQSVPAPPSLLQSVPATPSLPQSVPAPPSPSPLSGSAEDHIAAQDAQSLGHQPQPVPRPKPPLPLVFTSPAGLPQDAVVQLLGFAEQQAQHSMQLQAQLERQGRRMEELFMMWQEQRPGERASRQGERLLGQGDLEPPRQSTALALQAGGGENLRVLQLQLRLLQRQVGELVEGGPEVTRGGSLVRVLEQDVRRLQEQVAGLQQVIGKHELQQAAMLREKQHWRSLFRALAASEEDVGGSRPLQLIGEGELRASGQQPPPSADSTGTSHAAPMPLLNTLNIPRWSVSHSKPQLTERLLCPISPSYGPTHNNLLPDTSTPPDSLAAEPLHPEHSSSGSHDRRPSFNSRGANPDSRWAGQDSRRAGQDSRGAIQDSEGANPVSRGPLRDTSTTSFHKPVLSHDCDMEAASPYRKRPRHRYNTAVSLPTVSSGPSIWCPLAAAQLQYMPATSPVLQPTLPEFSQLSPHQPSHTEPSRTQPPHTQPPDAQPSHTQPQQAQLSHTQPQQAQPSHTQLPQAQPSRTQPPQAQFSHTQPPEAQPPQAQFSHTQPPRTQPPQAQSPRTQPPQAQLPRTQPPQAQPPHTQPPHAPLPHAQPLQAQPPRTQPPQAQPPHIPQAQPLHAQLSQAQLPHTQLSLTQPLGSALADTDISPFLSLTQSPAPQQPVENHHGAIGSQQVTPSLPHHGHQPCKTSIFHPHCPPEPGFLVTTRATTAMLPASQHALDVHAPQLHNIPQHDLQQHPDLQPNLPQSPLLHDQSSCQHADESPAHRALQSPSHPAPHPPPHHAHQSPAQPVTQPPSRPPSQPPSQPSSQPSSQPPSHPPSHHAPCVCEPVPLTVALAGPQQILHLPCAVSMPETAHAGLSPIAPIPLTLSHPEPPNNSYRASAQPPLPQANVDVPSLPPSQANSTVPLSQASITTPHIPSTPSHTVSPLQHTLLLQPNSTIPLMTSIPALADVSNSKGSSHTTAPQAEPRFSRSTHRTITPLNTHPPLASEHQTDLPHSSPPTYLQPRLPSPTGPFLSTPAAGPPFASPATGPSLTSLPAGPSISPQPPHDHTVTALLSSLLHPTTTAPPCPAEQYSDTVAQQLASMLLGGVCSWQFCLAAFENAVLECAAPRLTLDELTHSGTRLTGAVTMQTASGVTPGVTIHEPTNNGAGAVAGLMIHGKGVRTGQMTDGSTAMFIRETLDLSLGVPATEASTEVGLGEAEVGEVDVQGEDAVARMEVLPLWATGWCNPCAARRNAPGVLVCCAVQLACHLSSAGNPAACCDLQGLRGRESGVDQGRGEAREQEKEEGREEGRDEAMEQGTNRDCQEAAMLQQHLNQLQELGDVGQTGRIIGAAGLKNVHSDPTAPADLEDFSLALFQHLCSRFDDMDAGVSTCGSGPRGANGPHCLTPLWTISRCCAVAVAAAHIARLHGDRGLLHALLQRVLRAGAGMGPVAGTAASWVLPTAATAALVWPEAMETERAQAQHMPQPCSTPPPCTSQPHGAEPPPSSQSDRTQLPPSTHPHGTEPPPSSQSNLTPPLPSPQPHYTQLPPNFGSDRSQPPPSAQSPSSQPLPQQAVNRLENSTSLIPAGSPATKLGQHQPVHNAASVAAADEVELLAPASICKARHCRSTVRYTSITPSAEEVSRGSIVQHESDPLLCMLHAVLQDLCAAAAPDEVGRKAAEGPDRAGGWGAPSCPIPSSGGPSSRALSSGGLFYPLLPSGGLSYPLLSLEGACEKSGAHCLVYHNIENECGLDGQEGERLCINRPHQPRGPQDKGQRHGGSCWGAGMGVGRACRIGDGDTPSHGDGGVAAAGMSEGGPGVIKGGTAAAGLSAGGASGVRDGGIYTKGGSGIVDSRLHGSEARVVWQGSSQGVGPGVGRQHIVQCGNGGCGSLQAASVGLVALTEVQFWCLCAGLLRHFGTQCWGWKPTAESWVGAADEGGDGGDRSVATRAVHESTTTHGVGAVPQPIPTMVSMHTTGAAAQAVWQRMLWAWYELQGAVPVCPGLPRESEKYQLPAGWPECEREGDRELPAACLEVQREIARETLPAWCPRLQRQRVRDELPAASPELQIQGLLALLTSCCGALQLAACYMSSKWVENELLPSVCQQLLATFAQKRPQQIPPVPQPVPSMFHVDPDSLAAHPAVGTDRGASSAALRLLALGIALGCRLPCSAFISEDPSGSVDTQDMSAQTQAQGVTPQPRVQRVSTKMPAFKLLCTVLQEALMSTAHTHRGAVLAGCNAQRVAPSTTPAASRIANAGLELYQDPNLEPSLVPSLCSGVRGVGQAMGGPCCCAATGLAVLLDVWQHLPEPAQSTALQCITMTLAVACDPAGVDLKEKGGLVCPVLLKLLDMPANR